MRRLMLACTVMALGACSSGGSSPTAPSAPPPAPTPTPSPVAMPAPTPGPTPTPTTTPAPPSTPTVLRRATMQGSNGHAASGTVEIVRTGNAHTLEFRGDFGIDGGQNDVYLALQPGGITPSDLNLGNMKSRTGAQSYSMPNGGNGYRYVLIWCRPFQVPIGFGELR